MGEGQYDFSHLFPSIDIVAGANLKQYVLNSKGTIFIDSAAPIKINEWGAYAQLTKKLGKVLTLSFSGRYDKNEDFDGKFTPRATALVKIAKDHNFRFSYQTAYRFASTIQKYVLLNVGSYTLIGGLPWIENYLQKTVFDVTNGTPKPFVYKPLKPESMRSFEVGYKSLIGQRLLIDAYGYFGSYRNFYGRNVLLEAQTGRIFSSVVNSDNEVKTHGFGLSLDYRLPQNFSVRFNGYHDVLTDVPTNFHAAFNTPKYRANLGFGNSGLGKKKALGFNISAHWQDAYYSEGDLATGDINAFTTVDAQVNYKLLQQKLMIKIGGTNIFNHYYKNAYGNPEIGGLYYASLGLEL
jgi:outer membrane receptor protein involved in Fe transport